jgi:hypothetical protein
MAKAYRLKTMASLEKTKPATAHSISGGWYTGGSRKAR